MFRDLFAMAVLTYPIVSSAECLTTLPPYPAFIPRHRILPHRPTVDSGMEPTRYGLV